MNTVNANEPAAAWLKLVQERVGRLRFGVVQIVIHDARVVQIECTEKLRLDKADSDGPRGSQRRVGADLEPEDR